MSGGPGSRQITRRIVLNATGAAVFVIAVFPVYWMIITAFKTDEEIAAPSPHLVPYRPTFEHFRSIIDVGSGGQPVWIYLRNSLIVAFGTVLLGSLFALLAATGVARFRFRFRTTFLIMLLIVQMVPFEALAIPLFLMVKQVGLYNHLLGLIVVQIGLTLPFAIWMLRNFVAAIPKELEEAAAIDGAGTARIFWQILFPLVAPGLVATSIFSFITAWNEFILALTLLSDEGNYTMPVALRFFFGRNTTAWGSIMAFSTIMTLPVVAFFLLVQRRLVSGLVTGAVKG